MEQFTDFLLQNGIPKEGVVWLLLLPVMMTFVVATRQIIGIKGLGISAPLLLGFAIAIIGLQAGVTIFVILISGGFATKFLLTKIHLLYLPKVGLIILGAVSLLTVLLPFVPYDKDLSIYSAGFALLAIVLPMEQLASLLLERGPRRTLTAVNETALVALPIFYLANWGALQTLVLSYPIFVLAGLIVFNLLLGKWTGLRLSEYIRFKRIIFK